MKRILLGISFGLALATAGFAENRPTLESNEAAMKAGRIQVNNKTTELENKLKAHDLPAAQTSADNLLDLMRQGMTHTQTTLNLQNGDSQKQEVTNGHYLKMEKLTYDFQIASKNVSVNGTQLVDYARRYLKEY